MLFFCFKVYIYDMIHLYIYINVCVCGEAAELWGMAESLTGPVGDWPASQRERSPFQG